MNRDMIFKGLGLVKQASMIKTVPLTVKAPEGAVRGKLNAEVADTPAECTRGLSKRASLPSDRGMFFSCPGPFWMRDVYVPLDVVFLTKEGEIVDHATMPVVAPGQHLPLYFSKHEKTAYALEVPAGWCAKHNVVIGDRVVTE